MQNTLGKKYLLLTRIGKGSFGEVFRCEDKSTRKKYAVKIVPNNKSEILTKQLMNEIYIYKHIQNGIGIPKLYYSEIMVDKMFMVMDLLGRNLEDVFLHYNRSFTLKTVLQLADQMISRIEYLHRKGFIHRDLKPQNFILGKPDSLLYLIDYGLSKRYIDPNTGKHIIFSETKSEVGTIRYISLNSHRCFEQSRRDDMESLGYIFIYFLKGQLPWQGLNSTTPEIASKNVFQCKLDTSLEELCSGLPIEFHEYLQEVRSLRFDEEPHYSHYRSMFKNLLLREKMIYDDCFEWTKIPSQKTDKITKHRSVSAIPSLNQNSDPNITNLDKKKIVASLNAPMNYFLRINESKPQQDLLTAKKEKPLKTYSCLQSIIKIPKLSDNKTLVERTFNYLRQ